MVERRAHGAHSRADLSTLARRPRCGGSRRDSAKFFAVRRVDDGRDTVEIRAEADDALVYVDGGGPLDFDLAVRAGRHSLAALLAALRDGRVRGVGSIDERRRAVADRLELVHDDGEVVDSLLLPIDVPRRSRRGKTLIRYEPLR